MAKKERTVFNLIEDALKAHGVKPTPEAVDAVWNKLYVELKYEINPRELQEEIRKGVTGKATLKAYEIVSDMIKDRQLKTRESLPEGVKRSRISTKVDKLFYDYYTAKGIDRVIADTLVMMGVKPSREQIEDIRASVQARLAGEADPRVIKEEIRTGKPGPVTYAVMDLVKERKNRLEPLSPEELERLREMEKVTKEKMKKPVLTKPKFIEDLEKRLRRRKR